MVERITPAMTTGMVEALTTFMKDQKDIKKVYLLNQNYSHGHQVAKFAKVFFKILRVLRVLGG